MKSLLWVVIALLPPAVGMAATFSVDCSGAGEYTTIQEAVTAAGDGDTVAVAPCVYDEHVVVDGKNLTFIGSGAMNTELLWGGTESALVFADHPLSEYGKSRLSDLAVRHVGGRHAIDCEHGTVVLERCVTEGPVYVGQDYINNVADGDLEACDSSLEEVRVYGDDIHDSVFENCRIVSLRPCAASDWTGFAADASVVSSGCRIGALSMGSGGTVTSVGDSIGSVWIAERINVESALAATGCALGYLFDDGGGSVCLTECTVDSLFVHAYERGGLEMNRCLVLGPGRIRSELPSYDPGVHLTHVTFVDDLALYGLLAPSIVELTSSVVGGWLYGSGHANTLVRNNCFSVEPSFTGGVFSDNVIGDPLFCDPPGGDYSVQECSPCVGAALDGGVCGAFDVGCACATSVEDWTWGAIKALFGQPSD
jgi:hypothetical protein